MIDAAWIRESSYDVVDSVDGHMALFGADPGFMPQLDRIVKRLLAAA